MLCEYIEGGSINWAMSAFTLNKQSAYIFVNTADRGFQIIFES